MDGQVDGSLTTANINVYVSQICLPTKLNPLAELCFFSRILPTKSETKSVHL